MEDWQNGGFGIYIHWPFCQAKCPYCDFNSHVSQNIDQTRWARAYLSELDRIHALTKGRKLDTVFFGGGTPSLMEPELVSSILGRIRDLWAISNNVEITLEANPTSIEIGKFRDFSEAGITRVSMGIQALNDQDLKRLGRLHSKEEALKGFDIARTVFDRVSFDLIYARQDQTLKAWQAELKEALSYAIDHISLYQLTIESGTAFGDLYARGKLKGLPPDDTAADMYFATQDICSEAGFETYEISNHARAGQQSRHNLIYWRYGDYAGVGPGAHSRLTFGGARHTIDTPLAPLAWLDQVDSNGHGELSRAPLPHDEQALEYLMMGLRISEGISLERLKAIAGRPYINDYNDLSEMGLIEIEKDRLRVTPQGRPVLNAILRELIPT